MNPTDIYETEFPDILTMIYPWKDRYKNYFPFLKHLVNKYKSQSVLDAGCGDGLQLRIYKELGVFQKIVGIDNSTKMIQKTINNLKTKNIHDILVKQSDLLDIDKNIAGPFDLISCCFTLSTLNNKQKIITVLEKFKTLLSKGGTLLIEDTNADRLLSMKPPPEYLPVVSPYYRLLQKRSVEVTVYAYLPVPIRVSKFQNRYSIHLLSKLLYNWLQLKNFCYRTYQLYPPHVYTNYLIFRTGFFNRPDIRLFRTECLLLPNRTLTKLIRKVGFHKVISYSDHNFTKFRNQSFGQIIVAQL